MTQPGEARRFEKQAVDLVEIAVHDDVSPIFIVPADCVPQLEVEWMLVQPDVFECDRTWGWEPVRERGVFIGSEELARIKFRPGDDPATLCRVASVGEAVEIENFAETPLRVIARHRQ